MQQLQRFEENRRLNYEERRGNWLNVKCGIEQKFFSTGFIGKDDADQGYRLALLVGYTRHILELQLNLGNT